MGIDMKENKGEGLDLPRELANVVTPSMRQGLMIVNDSKEAEEVVRFFTAMIVGKDPYRIGDWRSEYVAVSGEELQEELKLLVMPLINELPIMRAVVLPDRQEHPAILRKIYIISLVPPTGFIVFSQPSIALLVNDNGKLYFGYKGINVDGGNKLVITIKSRIANHITVPFTPAIVRFVFIGDVVEAVIDESDHVKGL
jgi:hypothetical protein